MRGNILMYSDRLPVKRKYDNHFFRLKKI